MILTVMNLKGGTGKTCTAVSLAAGLAMKGKKVLLVDLDSQGSASRSLGVPRADSGPSSASILLDGLAVEKAARETTVAGLDIVPGSMELANADLMLSTVTRRVHRLRDALDFARKQYDFIVLDNSPSLSLLPTNALYAADKCILPVVPQYLALEGLENHMEAVEKMGEGVVGKSPIADLLGILLTQVDRRLRVTSQISEKIRKKYDGKVFNTEIPTNVRLAEAPSYGIPIFQYDSSSTGAQAYEMFINEVLLRIKETDQEKTVDMPVQSSDYSQGYSVPAAIARNPISS
jgi:chromosome partitioning protein